MNNTFRVVAHDCTGMCNVFCFIRKSPKFLVKRHSNVNLTIGRLIFSLGLPRVTKVRCVASTPRGDVAKCRFCYVHFTFRRREIRFFHTNGRYSQNYIPLNARRFLYVRVRIYFYFVFFVVVLIYIYTARRLFRNNGPSLGRSTHEI